jgi:hypothetical protein
MRTVLPAAPCSLPVFRPCTVAEEAPDARCLADEPASGAEISKLVSLTNDFNYFKLS